MPSTCRRPVPAQCHYRPGVLGDDRRHQLPERDRRDHDLRQALSDFFRRQGGHRGGRYLPGKRIWDKPGDGIDENREAIHEVLSTTATIGGILTLVTPPPISAIALGSLAAGADALLASSGATTGMRSARQLTGAKGKPFMQASPATALAIPQRMTGASHTSIDASTGIGFDSARHTDCGIDFGSTAGWLSRATGYSHS